MRPAGAASHAAGDVPALVGDDLGRACRSCADPLQGCERACGLAAVDRLRWRARRPASGPCALPATISAAALFSTTMSRKAFVLAAPAPCGWPRHCAPASPPLSSASAARFTPTSSGAISISLTLPFSSEAAQLAGRGRDLVHAVLAVHDQRALEAELAQRLGDRPEPAPVEYAHELALDQRRVRHRPQQVEDGARWARARPAGRRHCAWRCDGAAPSGSRRWPRPAPSPASRSAVRARCPAPPARRPRPTWR